MIAERQGQPEIALVICTRNRAERLACCLEAVKGMVYDGPWQLVVVNNGSYDNTLEVLEKYAEFFHGNITVVNEPSPGLGLARNRGWAATVAPIVAYTDDDCYPDSDFLGKIKAAFADDGLGFVGGRILLYDPTDARVTIEESVVEEFLTQLHLLLLDTFMGLTWLSGGRLWLILMDMMLILGRVCCLQLKTLMAYCVHRRLGGGGNMTPILLSIITMGASLDKTWSVSWKPMTLGEAPII